MNSLKENAMSGIPGPIRHGNVDMPNRASGLNYLAAVESCRMFLQELQDEHGEAMATRLVRESVSSVSRGDSHITHLPSSYTKRKLYGNWCYWQGWIVGCVSKNGGYGKIDDYKKRDIEEDWMEDSEYSPILSWGSFRRTWKKHYSNLRIRPKSEDIWDECVIFANEFRYATQEKKIYTLVYSVPFSLSTMVYA